MNNTNEPKYNVYIVDKKTREIVSTIGTNLSERMAERREMSGLMRIDTDNYFIDTVEVK